MTFLIVIAKLLASSAMLLAFFYAVLRNRASYKLMRLYLITIPFVSMMMSGLTIEVYKPEPKVVEIEQEAVMVNGKPYPVTAEGQETPVKAEPIVKEEQTLDDVDYVRYAQWVILAVSAVLLLVALYYILKMCVITRNMRAEKTSDGFNLIRSADVHSPFSFYNTIFMPLSMEVDKENLILMHEKAHVHNKHYIDVWIIEVMVRLLWFNPFMWVVRNQLRNVHEYEADRSVLASGADILRYQTILLEEVAEGNVLVANGFNHSFIRRRFLEMKNSSAFKLGRVGKVCTGAWMLLMFSFFTFTIGEAETIYNTKWKILKLHSVEAREDAVSKTDSIALKVEKKSENTEENKEMIAMSDAESEHIIDINTDIASPTEDEGLGIAPDGYPYVTDLPLNTMKHITNNGIYMKHENNETHVVCVGTCQEEDQWFWLGGDQTYIEDMDTGDHYKARRSLTKNCWDGFHVRGMKGQTFALTIVFPPLPDTVKRIRFWHLCSWCNMNGRVVNVSSYMIL